MSGRARVENKDGKPGYINKDNQVVISAQYQYATTFYKGFHKGLNYGLLDNKGKVVVDFNYYYLADYHDGKMFAHKSTFVK